MSGIVRLGAFLPTAIRSNDFWGEEWRDQHATRVQDDVITQLDRVADVDPEVARHSARFAQNLFRGSVERRVMAPGRFSSDMEADAARDIVGDAHIDLLMVASQVPDFPSPLNHGLVAHKLGLPRTVAAMTVDTGCASFLTQVALASRLVDTGAYRNALVIVSSAMSRILDPEAPSSPFVGDGAVAALISPSEDGFGFIDDEVITRGDLHSGIVLTGEDKATPWYRAPDPLLARHVDHQATHAMGARAVTRCREVCVPLLKRHGLQPTDIAFLATPHTTGWFGTAFADGLGIPEDRVLSHRDQFAKYGHLMAASVALNLHLAVEQGRIRRGDWVLAYSPGAGFTQAAQLLRWA